MGWEEVSQSEEVVFVDDVDHFRVRIWRRPALPGWAWPREEWRSDGSERIEDVLAWAQLQGTDAVVEVFAVPRVPTEGLMAGEDAVRSVRIFGAAPPGEDGGSVIVVVSEANPD
jgi:hypothetical protein